MVKSSCTQHSVVYTICVGQINQKGDSKMNLIQRFMKMDTESLKAYLKGAQQRTTNTNKMVSSAAKQSVTRITDELAKRAQA
jgi:hypothetical protein